MATTVTVTETTGPNNRNLSKKTPPALAGGVFEWGALEKS